MISIRLPSVPFPAQSVAGKEKAPNLQGLRQSEVHLPFAPNRTLSPKDFGIENSWSLRRPKRGKVIANVAPTQLNEMRNGVENLFALMTILAIGSLAVYSTAKTSEVTSALKNFRLNNDRFTKFVKEEANLHLHHQLDMENALTEIDALKREIAKLQKIQEKLRVMVPFVKWD